MTRWLVLAATFVLASCSEPSFEYTASSAKTREIIHGWPEYGGGTGEKYFRHSTITPDNVKELSVAWVYRTGDVSNGSIEGINSTTAFEVTPVTVDDKLVFCTPFNHIIALDPVTGGELWRHDPGIDLTGDYANQLICRGVAQWHVESVAGASASTCSTRVFSGTNDGYLIALDADTGKPCQDFGEAGRVNLNQGPGEQEWLGEYQVTSAPTVISDLVIVGSAISDNARIDAPSGVIRAFDAVTGEQRWAQDLAPPDFDYESGFVSEEGFALGTPNVWSTMTADESRDLVFVPTGNPSPDYYREGPVDMDYYGSSVVALRGSTGEIVWHFNTVIHDFWDYDVAAQPSLTEFNIDGRQVPVVVQGTKMGLVFVLDRETGEPVIDVEYRQVPIEGPLAGRLSDIQPFPPDAFRVSPEISQDDEWKLLRVYTDACQAFFSESRTGPLYTPVTEQWTIVAPSNAGGINWGGLAVDPDRGMITTRASTLPFRVRLIPRESFKGRQGTEFGIEFAEQRGTPFAMSRAPLLTPDPIPCIPPPWGLITGIDVNTRSQRWQHPHGTMKDLLGLPLPWGVPGIGGPILLDTGVMVLAGGYENAIRAYDSRTGQTLWHHRLPAGPQATPMTYAAMTENGPRQFIVIAAGGHARLGTTLGDYVIAFSLPGGTIPAPADTNPGEYSSGEIHGGDHDS